MKKLGTIAVLSALLVIPLSAQEAMDPFNGQSLHDGWLAYEKLDTLSDRTDIMKAGLYAGFVIGTIKGVLNLPLTPTPLFLIPGTVRNAQLLTIVGNYLNAHPEEWDKSRNI